MIAHTELRGFGPAVKCEASGTHNPVPLRYVWHHIEPQQCGGATEAANLVELCDSCHYSVHRLLWHLARNYLSLLAEGSGVPTGPVPRKAQLALAMRGLEACVAAGTVPQIPNEG